MWYGNGNQNQSKCYGIENRDQSEWYGVIDAYENTDQIKWYRMGIDTGPFDMVSKYASSLTRDISPVVPEMVF